MLLLTLRFRDVLYGFFMFIYEHGYHIYDNYEY